MTEWQPLIGIIVTALLGGISAAVTVIYRRLESLSDHVLTLATENAQLKAEIASVRDDLNVEREAHKLDNAKHERQIERLSDENRILRSALRANGINVDQYATNETPPGLLIRRRTEGERGE